MGIVKEGHSGVDTVRNDDIMITFTVTLYSNWGTECDPNFKGYHNGNSEPQGFGE